MESVISTIALNFADTGRLTVGLILFGLTLFACAIAKFNVKISTMLASIVVTLWAIH